MKPINAKPKLFVQFVAVCSGLYAADVAWASSVVYGGPAYTGGQGGIGGITPSISASQTTLANINPFIVSNPGSAITSGTSLGQGYVFTYSGPTTPPSINPNRLISYTTTTTGAVPLLPVSGGLGGDVAYGINASGMATGSSLLANVTVGTPPFVQTQVANQAAVKWDTTTGAGVPTILAPLQTSSSTGYSISAGKAINTSGVVVGQTETYIGSTDTGAIGARWSASGVPSALNALPGTSSSGKTNAGAVAVNTSGTAVGYSNTYSGSGGTFAGTYAVTWAVGSSIPTQLSSLTAPAGSTSSFATVINDSGISAGYATAYSGTTRLGYVPVRWDSTGNISQLSTSPASDGTMSGANQVNGLNAAGDAVGQAEVYSGSTDNGLQPMLWKAGGKAATPLALLGTYNGTGRTAGSDYAINTAGCSVGYVQKYAGNGSTFIDVATLWSPTGDVTDLNTLINATDASGTWTDLLVATAISDDGWISGYGIYTPIGTDNSGNALPAYNRQFLFQNPAAVPEPASLGLVAMTTSVLLERRRKR